MDVAVLKYVGSMVTKCKGGEKGDRKAIGIEII
jgi:hypothetical protein